MNSVHIHLGAADHTMEITMGGHVTNIDLSRMSRDERAHFAIQVWNWARHGYVGYPQVPQ